jgi:hypothetical protein
LPRPILGHRPVACDEDPPRRGSEAAIAAATAQNTTVPPIAQKEVDDSLAVLFSLSGPSGTVAT